MPLQLPLFFLGETNLARVYPEVQEIGHNEERFHPVVASRYLTSVSVRAVLPTRGLELGLALVKNRRSVLVTLTLITETAGINILSTTRSIVSRNLTSYSWLWLSIEESQKTSS